MKTLSAWLCALGLALTYLSWKLWWLIEDTHGANAFRMALSRVRVGLRHDESLRSIIDHLSQQIELVYVWLDIFLLATAGVAAALLVSALILFRHAMRMAPKHQSHNH
jgi:4-amino-4-deoxy-L-arabinose transferase-like glycosyltransferase